MARMTVPEACDTGTDAAGPATASASTATPATVNHTPPARAAPARGDPGRGERRGSPPGRGDGGPRQARGHQQADGQQDGVGEAHGRLRWVLATTSMSAVDQVASVPMRCMGTPARRIPAASLVSRSSTADPQPGAQQRVAGVDDELLPGLGVLDDDQADVGQLVVGGVHDAQRDDLVAGRQAQQRPPPVAVADEVGDDHDQGAAPGHLGGRVEHRREVGGLAAAAWGGGGGPRVRRRCAARARAGAGRHDADDAACRTAARRRGCRPGRTAGRAPGQARRARRACRGRGRPTVIDAERSSTSQTVSSRSSMN